jgi:hypothetical protein
MNSRFPTEPSTEDLLRENGLSVTVNTQKPVKIGGTVVGPNLSLRSGNSSPADAVRQQSKERGTGIFRKRAIALLVGGVVAVGGVKAYDIATSSSKAEVIEAANDNNAERDAVEASTVSYGKLTINPGTNVRHTPNIQNPDESTGDFQENIASNEIALSIEDPILYFSPLDNRSYYGFTVEDNGGKSGLYWVATETGGQFDEQGNPFTLFEPNQSMQNAMSPDLKPMLISTDSGQFLSIPDKTGALPIAQASPVQS